VPRAASELSTCGGIGADGAMGREVALALAEVRPAGYEMGSSLGRVDEDSTESGAHANVTVLPGVHGRPPT
jgi:hypothetical protein